MYFYRSRRDISRRHNLVILAMFDSVSSRKTLTLKFYFQNKIIRRHLSSQILNKIIEHKRELEQKLTPLILKNLKNKIWPLEDPELAKGVKEYFNLSNRLLSIMSSRKFIRSFSINIDDNCKILAENYEALNTKRPNPLVDRKKMKDSDNWVEILNEAELTIDSLLTKIWAVELVSTSEGCLTPGVDNLCFLSVPRLTKSKTDALRYLNDLTKKLKHDIKSSQGSTNQAIQRKGIDNLNTREKYRRYLKNPKGKLYIKRCKEQYRVILKNPLEYLNKLRSFAIENNIKLKFKLIKSLKLLKIKNYSADPILRVWIPKNKKLRPLGISTLKDRTLQTLLKLVMESYLEPLGDRNSFGFRPGRNSHQAISYLYKRLTIRKSSTSKKKRISPKVKSTLKLKIKKFKNIEKYFDSDKQLVINKIIAKNSVSNQEIRKLLVREKKIYYVPYYLLDADIETCFDKISHEWLLLNVPIPPKYKFLLKKILKPDIVEKNKIILKKENNNCGVFQGGILSPLLINWALDGIESLVFETVASIKSDEGKTYYDFDKYKYYQNRDRDNKKSESHFKKLATVELKYTSWLIRYADDFIIGIKGELPLKQVQYKLKLFLAARGLALSDEKTKIIKWSSNAKIDFLSWTCHYLVPKRVSWIIRKNKDLAGRLADWAGLYVYPSKNSVSKLKSRIKRITNHQNSWKAEEVIIKTIANLVVGWSNYFSPAPGQGSLRLAIDWYIFQRMKRYIHKKYGHSYLKNYLRLNQNEDGSRKKSIGISGFQNTREKSLFIPRLYDLNTPAMWTELVPTQELCNFSYLTNPIPYIKRALQITKLRQDLKSKLFFKQKELCNLCNQELVNWNSKLFASCDFFMDSFNQTNSGLSEITLNNYYSQINSATINLNSTSKFDMNYQLSGNSKSINRIITLKSANFAYRKIDDLWKDLDLDHIIPIKLAGKITALKDLLNGINNLRLVHKSCHKNKTFNSEEQKLLKNYRKTRKFLVPANTKLSMLTENELNKLHLKTILKLEEDKGFEYLHQFDNKIIKKLFKIYIIQVKKLKSINYYD